LSSLPELRSTALAGLDEGRAFDTPFLRLADTARSWQLAFYVAIAVVAILVVSLAQLAVHSRVLVHVVEVDPLGRTVYAGPARELSDPEPYVRHELAELLIDLRTVVADRRAVSQPLAGSNPAVASIRTTFLTTGARHRGQGSRGRWDGYRRARHDRTVGPMKHGDLHRTACYGVIAFVHPHLAPSPSSEL
jgi:hypothetical protein